MAKRRTIGALAKETGVGIQAIRFYEKEGVLPRAPRTDSGYREYSESDAQRVRFVKRAQSLGFTLAEIKDLLQLNQRSTATCAGIRKQAQRKIAEIEAKIGDLQAIRARLEDVILATGDGKKAAAGCTIYDCLC